MRKRCGFFVETGGIPCEGLSRYFDGRTRVYVWFYCIIQLCLCLLWIQDSLRASTLFLALYWIHISIVFLYCLFGIIVSGSFYGNAYDNSFKISHPIKAKYKVSLIYSCIYIYIEFTFQLYSYIFSSKFWLHVVFFCFIFCINDTIMVFLKFYIRYVSLISN